MSEVDSPKHYTVSAVDIHTEPRDVMFFLCPEAIPIMAFKYLMRYKYKGSPEEDLKKALNYLEYYQEDRYVSCSDVKTFLKKNHLAEIFIRCYMCNNYDELIDKINSILNQGEKDDLSV